MQFFFFHFNPSVQSNWLSVKSVETTDVQETRVFDKIEIGNKGYEVGPTKSVSSFKLNELELT